MIYLTKKNEKEPNVVAISSTGKDVQVNKTIIIQNIENGVCWVLINALFNYAEMPYVILKQKVRGISLFIVLCTHMCHTVKSK